MGKEKVVILGAGHVGSHCAFALALRGSCWEIVLVDVLPEKAAAQAMDISDSLSFSARPVEVRWGGCGECAEADLVVPIATSTAQTAKAVYDGTETPLVFAAVSDPDAAGLTGAGSSWGRRTSPGRRTTGGL